MKLLFVIIKHFFFRRERIKHTGTSIHFSGFSRVNKWVSQEDLDRVIRIFFRENGLDLQEHGIKLTVVFKPKGGLGYSKSPGEDFLVGGKTNTNYWSSRSTVKVCTKKLRKRFNFDRHVSMLRILAHELDHVVWAYQNKGYFNTRPPYSKQAHEIRAVSSAEDWALRFQLLLKQK